MCGKYGGPAELEVFAGYLPIPAPLKTVTAREDLSPMKAVSVLAKNARGEVVIKEMRWGLIPANFTGHLADWRASTFHACLETVGEKASFQNAWAKKRRVIFPMNHYSEKLRSGGDLLGRSRAMARVAITRADSKPLGVAGLYDYAQTADGPVLSVAMLTRAPGPRMLRIHDREPVVIEPEDFQPWLDGADLELGKPWDDDAFDIRFAA